LDFNEPFMDEHHLRGIGDTGDPGTGEQLRVERLGAHQAAPGSD